MVGAKVTLANLILQTFLSFVYDGHCQGNTRKPSSYRDLYHSFTKVKNIFTPKLIKVLHDWCNKGRDMCNPVCGMVHIKEPLLLIEKSSPCGGSRFPLSLSEWSFTICLMPYNRK